MPDPKWASAGGVEYVPQALWDTDPGTPLPVQIPLAGEANVGADQDPMSQDIFMEDRKTGGMVPGPISARGTFPVGMEFKFIGYPLRDFLTTYTHVATTGLHRFQAGATQRYFIAQKNLRGGTALFLRLLNCLASSLNWTLPDSGPVNLNFGFTANGNEKYTDIGGTVENNGYFPMSAFWGVILKDGVDVSADLTKLSAEISCTVNEQRGPFGDGKAKMLAAGPINFKGEIGLLVRDDLNFYMASVNATRARLDIFLCDAPPDYADRWLRLSCSRGLFSRKGPRVGTISGVKVEQAFQAERATATADGYSAENFGTIRGPYNIGSGTTDKMLVSIDGGANLGPITIPNGAAVTVDQIVTAVNAFTGMSAVAVADKFMGRFRLTSKSKGTSSSVEFKTQTGSCYAVLGLDTTIRTGQAADAFKVELYNPDKTTDYA